MALNPMDKHIKENFVITYSNEMLRLHLQGVSQPVDVDMRQTKRVRSDPHNNDRRASVRSCCVPSSLPHLRPTAAHDKK